MNVHDRMVEEGVFASKPTNKTENTKYPSHLYKNESIVDGKYCSSVNVSTSDETEFVTLSFLSLGNSMNIQMTKSQFNKFVFNLYEFSNEVSGNKTQLKKPLIQD